MSSNNKNFFKAIYMFVVLFLLDVALVYSLVQLGNGSYRKIDAIVCFGAINAVFIYLNFGEIKVIYRYIKEGRFGEGIKKAIRLLKYSKTSYFTRISSIIIGICFIIVFRLVRDVVANHKTTRYAGAATKVIQKNHLA